MVKKNVPAFVLSILGSVLVLFPIVFALVVGAVHSLQVGRLQIDFLIPFEIFPVPLAGMILVLIAALLARSHVKPVLWCLGVLIACIAGGAAFARLSGLATGEHEDAWAKAVLFGIIGIALLAMVAFAVIGILLAVRLMKKPAA